MRAMGVGDGGDPPLAVGPLSLCQFLCQFLDHT